MWRTESTATVPDCPKLKRLSPDSCHFPPITKVSENKKQSATPIMKAPP